jgi:hypothetical protein
MGYSVKAEVIQALANVLTAGSPNPGPLGTIPVTSIGKSVTDTVPDSDIQQYIRWADENIDATISSIYDIPLRRVNRGTFRLAMDVTAGDSALVLEDATKFIEGDVVLIRNDSTSQQLTVVSFLPVSPDTTMQVTPVVTSSYLAADAKVERIRYPDPIPKCSARLAASYLYDKHFSAQVEANQSEFGKVLRKLAYEDLNAVLSGAIRLLIPDANIYVGRRFYNHALGDVIDTRAEPAKKWIDPTGAGA